MLLLYLTRLENAINSSPRKGTAFNLTPALLTISDIDSQHSVRHFLITMVNLEELIADEVVFTTHTAHTGELIDKLTDLEAHRSDIQKLILL